MEPLFQTPKPFIIKVYNRHFEINWEDALPCPEDNYLLDDIECVKIIKGRVKRSFSESVFNFFFKNRYAERIENYDEILIVFKNGNSETRYIHGQATEEISEAVEMITNLKQGIHFKH